MRTKGPCWSAAVHEQEVGARRVRLGAVDLGAARDLLAGLAVARSEVGNRGEVCQDADLEAAGGVEVEAVDHVGARLGPGGAGAPDSGFVRARLSGVTYDRRDASGELERLGRVARVVGSGIDPEDLELELPDSIRGAVHHELVVSSG